VRRRWSGCWRGGWSIGGLWLDADASVGSDTCRGRRVGCAGGERGVDLGERALAVRAGFASRSCGGVVVVDRAALVVVAGAVLGDRAVLAEADIGGAGGGG